VIKIHTYSFSSVFERFVSSFLLLEAIIEQIGVLRLLNIRRERIENYQHFIRTKQSLFRSKVTNFENGKL